MEEKKYRKLEFEEILAKRPTVEQLAARPRRPVVVLLDNIRSLHNVGAIFRTADAINVDHIYLCGITGCPPRDEIRKTSLGAEESVPWSYKKDALKTIEKLQGRGYQIVVLEHTDKSADFRHAEYLFPLCLIVGNEYNGIQEPLVGASELAVEIPMYGIKQSLNVSVAFGVMAFELLNHLEE